MNRGGQMNRGNMSRGGGGNMNRTGNRGHPGQVGGTRCGISFVTSPYSCELKCPNMMLYFTCLLSSIVPTERW